jgi:hypothetical protein
MGHEDMGALPDDEYEADTPEAELVEGQGILLDALHSPACPDRSSRGQSRGDVLQALVRTSGRAGPNLQSHVPVRERVEW